MIALVEIMTKFIKRCGGELFIITYDDDVKIIEKKIDGLLIPGGRDINPVFYGHEHTGSILEDDSLIRYPFMKKMYEEIDPDIPIFGICWGF